MDARRLRLTLAAFHLAALLGADLGHRHHRDEPRADCATSCATPGVHLSGHDAPDLSARHGDCPACLLRVAPALAPAAVARDAEPSAADLVAADAPPRSLRPLAAPCVRGPPRGPVPHHA